MGESELFRRVMNRIEDAVITPVARRAINMRSFCICLFYYRIRTLCSNLIIFVVNILYLSAIKYRATKCEL